MRKEGKVKNNESLYESLKVTLRNMFSSRSFGHVWIYEYFN